jgi:hypothetical protein
MRKSGAMSVHEFPPSRPAPAAVTWRENLDQAMTEREVLLLVREYIARLDPHELSLLPAQSRPGKFFDADDVAGFTLDLIRSHLADVEASPPMAVELMAFFSHASQRLSEMAGSANDANRTQGAVQSTS